MTTEQIRRELQDIRYYYSHKAMFDRASDCVAKSTAVGLAEKYNAAIGSAPPRLYDLYISLRSLFACARPQIKIFLSISPDSLKKGGVEDDPVWQP